MADTQLHKARDAAFYSNWLIAAATGLAVLTLLAVAPFGPNARAVRELQAIMSYYPASGRVDGLSGGVAGGDLQNMCAAFRPPGTPLDPARRPSSLAVDDPLWTARWAFALCDRELLEVVASSPASTTGTLSILFKAYANWQLEDEETFFELVAGNRLAMAMFRAKALDAAGAHDWPVAWNYARIASRLGANDPRLLLTYADSGLLSGRPLSEALPVLELARDAAPDSFLAYQSLVYAYLDRTNPPDLDAAEANLEKACAYGMDAAHCLLLRGRIAYLRGDYVRALAESEAAQTSGEPGYRQQATVQAARSLARLGRLAEAANMMGGVVASAPDRSDYIPEYLSLLVQAGDFETALAQCRELARRCPACLADTEFEAVLEYLPECRP